MSLERLTENLNKREPIKETSSSVSYLGVRLEKAKVKNSPYVPKREHYLDYINDAFSLEMQKALAINFLLGDPILIEGGTSIGKTTTVRKMASELGYEVHYANLNGATDVEDLMGRYIPNPNKHRPEDPEYVFSDGKVTSGLRIEEGKIKVIILDEVNAAAPNILIRLHETLDALGRGEDLILAEDAAESVPVDKNKTKIVALMNPPGKGYFGREPLDPAQLRRWMYYKAPSELPKESFSHATDALFSLTPQTEIVTEDIITPQRDLKLPPELLNEIPGIKEILAQYKEFHVAAKQLVKERKIAADQPQQFTYDDRMEPRRVRDFILAFYNGDINQTFQNALRFYYSNKLESEVDKAELDELIAHIEYIPPPKQSLLRRGLNSLGVKLEKPNINSAEEMRMISEEKRAWKKVLGAEVDVKPLPDYVTSEVKANLKKLGFELRYIPALDLEEEKFKTTVDVDGYLELLKSHFPNWKPHEELGDFEKGDPKIVRNIENVYWEKIEDEKINFPQLSGQWVAVETVKKPERSDEYETNEFARKIGFADSRDSSWKKINKAFSDHKEAILSEARLPNNLELRLLEALEWNLLGNREGWGDTSRYEWTNTICRCPGSRCGVLIGNRNYGGVGDTAHASIDSDENNHGFRAAIVLKNS